MLFKKLFLSIALSFSLSPYLVAAEFTVYVFNYPPFINREDSEHPGLFVELIEKALEKHGHKPKFLYVPVARISYFLKKDPNAIALGARTTYKKKMNSLDFFPVFDASLNLLVSKTIGSNAQPEDLQYKKVIGLVGGVHQKKLAEKIGMTYIPISSTENGAKMVATGRAEASFCVLITCYQLRDKLSKELQEKIEIMKTPLHLFTGDVLFLEGQASEAVSLVKKGLKTLHDSGEVDEIFNYYYGKYTYSQGYKEFINSY